VVSLLLDLVYRSDLISAGGDGDPPVPDVLAALSLAGRWQVCRGGIARTLERHLAGRVDVEHFPALCDASLRQGLDGLKHSCMTWARNNQALVETIRERLSPEVRILVDPTLFPCSTPPPLKKRRMTL